MFGELCAEPTMYCSEQMPVVRAEGNLRAIGQRRVRDLDLGSTGLKVLQAGHVFSVKLPWIGKIARLHFLRRMASSVEVQAQTAQQLQEEFGHRGLRFPPGVLVYRVEGPFFFGAVENFERALASTHTDPDVVILRLRWVPFMDITGLQTLEEVVRDLQRRKVRVMLTGANERVTAKLEKAGILELLGRENFCSDLPHALSVISARTHDTTD
jgi:anti-anti-sigma factor